MGFCNRLLDKEIKGLDKQRGDLGTRIEELEKIDKSLLLPIAAIIIALIGGLPGIFVVINHFYKRPKFSFHFVSWINGSMVNSKENKEYTLIVLTGTVSNKGSEPLTPDHFELKAKVNGKWHQFLGMLIPENVKYDSEFQDIKLANAWEKDLQKASKPISQGVPLYGHLQFISDQISLEELRESKKVILEIMCKDIFGKEHKVKIPISGQGKISEKQNISHFKHGVEVTRKKNS